MLSINEGNQLLLFQLFKVPSHKADWLSTGEAAIVSSPQEIGYLCAQSSLDFVISQDTWLVDRLERLQQSR